MRCRRLLIAMLLLASAAAIGCGAAEHHENLKAAQSTQAELLKERDAEDTRRNTALAQIALQQRELRKELADAKRINAQMLAEMENDR